MLVLETLFPKRESGSMIASDNKSDRDCDTSSRPVYESRAKEQTEPSIRAANAALTLTARAYSCVHVT